MISRDTSGAAMEAFLTGGIDPERRLAPAEVRLIREALEAASDVLERASTSKQFRLSRDARAARTRVLHAWGILKRQTP